MFESLFVVLIIAIAALAVQLGVSVINDNITHQGQETFRSITLPTGCVGDGQIGTNAGIQASKVIQQHSISVQPFGPTTTVAAVTQWIHGIYGLTGTILDFRAALYTAATGSDRTVNVDLQRSTGGGAFATVLSGTIAFTHSSTPLTFSAGAISAAGVVQGDTLQIVVTVAGSASAQALGLLVMLTIQETPQ